MLLNGKEGQLNRSVPFNRSVSIVKILTLFSGGSTWRQETVNYEVLILSVEMLGSDPGLRAHPVTALSLIPPPIPLCSVGNRTLRQFPR